ncbi:glycosyltransferase family 4 protein [Commensalibacter oyaizuii]|uniref:Glycosyltransferase family 4 protein n=1 Tax=Commensalibacter oyaizuii TaxID=3043873 RepID=A0ABT6Q353_9PROT|nr:glycosyltransferase family 4 protein [Commensalibacter sp. TBRC 16381]MDI2091564.1 glycosyltransferase family 4 protein [Commensalibacter sp. TBRC 16381]
MKILEVANVDFSLYQFVLPLMRVLQTQGHEVIGVCAEGELLKDIRKEGIPVIAVPFIRSYAVWGQLKAFWAIYQVIKREQPDIVHAHMPISGFLTRMAAFLCRTPIIAYTCHGYLFNQSGRGIKSWFRRSLSFVMEWLAGKVTHIYMTVSKEEAKDARRFWIHRRAVSIGNGRDPKRFYPDRLQKEKIRRDLNIDSEVTVFLIVSRLVPHKGYPELLKAFMNVVKHKPKVELWVVGERLTSDHGDSLDALFQQAQQSLGKQLKLWGYRRNINELMRAADVFVLPSHFEGLPMSIVEAMLSALPVVSTSIRGPREQVEHNITGLLIKPGSVSALTQALIWMTEHHEERQAMGCAGYRKALDEFTEDKNIQAILSTFETIMNKKHVC